MEKGDFIKLLDRSLQGFRAELLREYSVAQGHLNRTDLKSPTPGSTAASRKVSQDDLALTKKPSSNAVSFEDTSPSLVAAYRGGGDKALLTSQRLRVRLGVLSGKHLISGKSLHGAVGALGLTRYSVEDMNNFVNALATFIDLSFATASWTEEDGLPSGHALWSWPTTAVDHVESSSRASHDARAPRSYNVVPAQALIELFVADMRGDPKKIFNANLYVQFQAIREILLAGETNRLVSELTFVRINDLAAPLERVHPVLYLEPIVAVLIITNGIMIGFQTTPEYKGWEGWVYLEIMFTTLLWLEMLIRMRLLHCRGYWCGTDRYWNYFDVFLALTSLADVCLQAILQQNSDIAGTSLLRFCRLIRLARIVKVFRMRIMKDLRLMVKGLIAGIRTLALSATLLFAVLYVIAGFATMTIGSSDSDYADYFLNIPKSMFTSFRCFCGECVADGGESIPSTLEKEFGLIFIVGYVMSYMLVTLGIFNVILAVYVDITMKAAKENEAITAEQHSRESVRIAQCVRELLKKIRAAYRTFNEGNESANLREAFDSTAFADDEIETDVEISKDIFLLMVQDRGVQKLMDELELPPDRATLFEAIDADGSGTLQMGELVQGLLKIRGELNKSDTVATLLTTKALQKSMLKISSKLDTISSTLADLAFQPFSQSGSTRSEEVEVHLQPHASTRPDIPFPMVPSIRPKVEDEDDLLPFY